MRAGNDLGSGRIGVLVGRIALPSMLAQFISVLYSIVDRIFIGQIPGEGALALAGAGVCGPVVTMVGSVAFLVGVGGAPLLSIKRGEGDDDAARGILANCFLMLCVFSVALPAAILPFREPMLRLFGASDATYPYAEAYFTLYLLGTPFALLASGLNQFIVCQGFAADGMKSVALGAVLNIVLDPVFIFAFGLGVRGAAIATVLSQLASCVYAVRFLLGQKPPHPHHTGRIFRGRHEACADAGLFAVHHHRAGQRDDHCHERRASALRRRGAGRRSGDLRHHRPKLHARCDDAAGRHHRGHAVYFKL